MELNTSIGNRGYTVLKDELSSSQITQIRSDLSVKPFVNTNYQQELPPFPIYCESKRKLYIPRFYGIEHFGDPKQIRIDSPTKIEIDFSKSLKKKQEPIVDAFMKSCGEDFGGGIISVPCGFGKTVIALYIAAKLGLKTLVVVHKEFLLNQWKERIEEFLPDARIGRLQSKYVQVEERDIVIGMLQSISMIEYEEDIFKEFGLVIYDECHHLGAEVFSKALLKTSAKYTLGLSATPKRADGLSKVFEWYLGGLVYQIKKREKETVDVKLIDYKNEDPLYSEVKLNFNGKPNSACMINNICEYPPRLDVIINETVECLKEGRKILILSDRREHLKQIKNRIDKLEGWTCGFYLGGMKQSELEKTEKMNVILGTFAMASEGFDCREPLDTIMLASPKSNIEQAVGRILRIEEKDRVRVPLVIDIIDSFASFKNQAVKRMRFYKKNNYDMTLYDNEGTEIDNYYMPNSKKKKYGGGFSQNVDPIDFDFLPD